ncbi:BamA/OMP85 family outer membrane protein [Tundrisphaera sp. TA3]|uniref:BamA/OMP85 family outer membrane protein n=1 Tax=Tundrisphaera sp. TA3 TaxID=3435775 RepID=UPI003EB71D16
MTRGDTNIPPAPGKAGAAGKTAALRRCLRASSVALLIGLILATLSAHAQAANGKGLPEGPITEVRIEGNASIPESKLRAEITSRTGRPLDRNTIDADVKKLLATKWFSDVYADFDPTPDGKGFILTFHVAEMPILKEVEFIGRSKVSLKDIQATTGLKKGERADAIRARLAVNQIKTLYEEKGFEKAEVKLVEGGNPDDTRVVIEIFEGPKFKVSSIDFIGNQFVSDDVLKTKIESRRGIFGLNFLGGKRHKDGVDEDRRKLIEYYQGNGFFDIDIRPVVRQGDDLGEDVITFVIDEGPQYKIRNIIFEGNQKLKDPELRKDLTLHSGQTYNDAIRDADLKLINSRYWELGCIDAKIVPSQKITDQPDVVDIVYNIEEGDLYTLGQIIIKGNARTQEKVLRREALMAGLLPGEVLDLNRIDKYKQRLGGLQYFVTDPQQGKPLDVRIVNRRKADKPFGEDVTVSPETHELTRLQSPDLDPAPGGSAVELPAMPDAAAGPQTIKPFGSIGREFQPEVDTVPPVAVPSAPPTIEPLPAAPPVIGDFPADPRTDPSFGREPSLPLNNQNDVGPDRNEPFPGRAYADIVTNVDEAPTGRLLFGLGASSFGGLSGNVVLHESNFDLFAIPRSFKEIGNGRAFRGAGQEFRVELSPGTSINRYVVSFRDPYLFDLPLGFGVSGYQFSRSYPDFTEKRSGGRMSLGYQFGTQTYADVAVRAEDVNITGFNYPAPAELLAVAGHTTLVTLRPSIRFDNRNNPFAPSKGSYLEAAFEQGWGSFTFPKVTVEGRQHWTTGSRPDGSGKRTLTARGFFGITGRDTPIYERFFAGDFRSMRGFYYRGVGPHILGVNTGGILTTVGSLEYQFPWTANDQIQQVFFADFGTVESDYSFTTFRAAVGTGLRVIIPQITKQMPLAFDIAFPVSKGPDDRTRYFTFFIGAFW